MLWTACSVIVGEGKMPERTFNIVWYDRKGRRSDDPAGVSVERSGNVVVNAAAYDLLGRPSHVLPGYDPTEKVIALRPVPADTRNACAVARSSRSRSYIVHLRGFMTYHHIDISRARRFPAMLHDDNLVFDLTQSQAVTSPPRSSNTSVTRRAR